MTLGGDIVLVSTGDGRYGDGALVSVTSILGPEKTCIIITQKRIEEKQYA